MAQGIILCVDDERNVLNGIQSQLIREFGSKYIIELAESGEEALEIASLSLNEGYDIPIIITDQLMPGLKGHELLIEFYKLSPSTFKILLTGQSDFESITKAVNHAKLYRYIAKPWESQDLLMSIKEALKGFYQEKQLNIQNRLLEEYNKDLEKQIAIRTIEVKQEKEKSDKLLNNILPIEISNELKEKGEVIPIFYKMVSVLFTDFKSFTKSASEISPHELINTLNEAFTAFDDIISKHNLEKIKTIGDAYMCVGGLPKVNTQNPINAVSAALEIRDWVDLWNKKRLENNLPKWEIRIGVHTGELIAGVIGTKKFAYDVWGDTVNITSSLENKSEAGKVNISNVTYEFVKDYFEFTPRGNITTKGNVDIEMYFVNKKLVNHKL